MDETLTWIGLLGWAPPFLRRWLRGLVLLLGADEPAFDTLRRRYAAGEITREEFEDMMEILAMELAEWQERR